MRTILIAHNYTENSFAAMSYHLAHHLADVGNRVVFISHRPFFKETQIIKKKKGEIIICSWATERRPTSFADIFWFAKIYLRYKPEIVIGHFVGNNISILFSKLLSVGKVKTLAYYHTLTNQILIDSNKKKSIQSLLFFRKRLFYKLFCDLIVCPSEFAKMDLKSFHNVNKGIVVLNPMMDRFVTKDKNIENTIVISYLGRLENSKGVLDMINAFIEYKSKNCRSKIVLNIAGSGSKSKEVAQLISGLESISFLGNLPYNEIDGYLNKSHFAIIPSKFDAFNMVGIEAMMNGTPLLISNTTGLSNYLLDGRECFKFDSTINSMISLFNQIEKKEFNYEEMSNSARATYLELFSLESYYKSISKIL
ncbi:glycosyltransferase family 4 protein [Flavobacterium ustbae]|uniref:glycosyltransferase family 4 protein n=1 Tax=Flavobacterium ustbae TaxID=2488790 RepID=UPI000F794C12|nr:glycosyltransferase family 4 protein [Flavobacterium ustbae]